MKTGILGIFAFISVLLPLACTSIGHRNSCMDDLKKQLHEYVDTLDATVGIAVITAHGDTLTVNNNIEYPLMSVFKFHQALAVADFMQKNNISFDSCIHIYPKDIELDTWSPMKKKYPEANMKIPIRKLLEYSLSQSDNLACDILFDRFLSPGQVDSFISSHEIRETKIRYNEAQMSADHDLSYGNTATPYAAALLLNKFIDGDIIQEPAQSCIKQIMLDCTTGSNRLAAAFRESGYKLGHKTGSGYKKNNRIISTNDIGFVLSDQDHKLYTIAVFVKDSGLSETETEEIIGNISEIVFRGLSDYLKQKAS